MLAGSNIVVSRCRLCHGLHLCIPNKHQPLLLLLVCSRATTSEPTFFHRSLSLWDIDSIFISAMLLATVLIGIALQNTMFAITSLLPASFYWQTSCLHCVHLYACVRSLILLMIAFLFLPHFFLFAFLFTRQYQEELICCSAITEFLPFLLLIEIKSTPPLSNLFSSWFFFPHFSSLCSSFKLLPPCHLLLITLFF